MEPKQILRAGKRWGWLGLIPLVIVGLHLILTYPTPPTPYQVTMRFTTGGHPAAALSSDYDRYYAWLSSEYIANGLADLAVTSSFAQAVADRLQADGTIVSPQAIQASIATNNTQSVLVVYLTWPDQVQAVTIAKAISRELIENGPNYYPQMDAIGTVVRQVDIPVAAPMPQSLRTRLLGPAIRLTIAVVAGVGLMLVAYWLDPWVRERSELENDEIPVIGVVPRMKRW